MSLNINQIAGVPTFGSDRKCPPNTTVCTNYGLTEDQFVRSGTGSTPATGVRFGGKAQENPVKFVHSDVTDAVFDLLDNKKSMVHFKGGDYHALIIRDPEQPGTTKALIQSSDGKKFVTFKLYDPHVGIGNYAFHEATLNDIPEAKMTPEQKTEAYAIGQQVLRNGSFITESEYTDLVLTATS